MDELEIADMVISLLSLGFMVLYLLVMYVIGVVGYLRLAKSINYKYKIVAFVPFVRVMILNKLMDDKVIKVLRGRLNLLLVVLPILFMILLGFMGIFTVVVGILATEVEALFLVGFISIMFIGTLVSYLFYGVFLCVVYEYYKEYLGDNHVVWFVLTIIFGNIVHNISLLKVKDDLTVLEVDIEEDPE